jgi:hypothetical protein
MMTKATTVKTDHHYFGVLAMVVTATSLLLVAPLKPAEQH